MVSNLKALLCLTYLMKQDHLFWSCEVEVDKGGVPNRFNDVTFCLICPPDTER